MVLSHDRVFPLHKVLGITPVAERHDNLGHRASSREVNPVVNVGRSSSVVDKHRAYGRRHTTSVGACVRFLDQAGAYKVNARRPVIRDAVVLKNLYVS